jgi:hypothetical protein
MASGGRKLRRDRRNDRELAEAEWHLSGSGSTSARVAGARTCGDGDRGGRMAGGPAGPSGRDGRAPGQRKTTRASGEARFPDPAREGRSPAGASDGAERRRERKLSLSSARPARGPLRDERVERVAGPLELAREGSPGPITGLATADGVRALRQERRVREDRLTLPGVDRTVTWTTHRAHCGVVSICPLALPAHALHGALDLGHGDHHPLPSDDVRCVAAASPRARS